MDIIWTWKTYLHSLAHRWSLENTVWDILSRLASILDTGDCSYLRQYLSCETQLNLER